MLDAYEPKILGNSKQYYETEPNIIWARAGNPAFM